MMLDRRSPVLEKLAELYAESVAGTTGSAARDFGVRFLKLLDQAGCTKGEAFVLAESDLRHAETVAAIHIEKHGRSHDWQRVCVPLAGEAALFDLIGKPSPTAEREEWAALFEEASSWAVPDARREAWEQFCNSRSAQARAGAGWKPFRRAHRKRARIYLDIAAKLLAWNRPCLLRTASAQLSGSSKFLESAAAALEEILRLASGGVVCSFADLGIDHSPSKVCFHGPVRIRLRSVETSYAGHAGESALSEADLAQMESVLCDARRCITVENATKFHELCRLGSGDVFVFTSYPNKATVHFLKQLPPEMPLFHFGDTDPWGFDVLRTLRQVLDRPVQPLHMRYRPKEGSPLLNERDRRKLARLLNEPLLSDVRSELDQLAAAGRKGDFEQETLILTQAAFPYAGESAFAG
jgi:hypothetical protein